MSLSIEQELNELRSLVAQSVSAPPKTVKALEARLSALEERVKSEVAADPSAAKRAAIMQALSVAKDGKPGYLTSTQIQERCKLTKSEEHTHVNALEKAGKVWIRKTHDPESGRPCFFVYHPAAVRA